MADLGNRTHALRLQCERCGWPPPEDAKLEAVLLHMQVEHDTDEVKMDLVAVCSCGEVMDHTGSRPTGGGFKDYMLCPACGNTGHVVRREDGVGKWKPPGALGLSLRPLSLCAGHFFTCQPPEPNPGGWPLSRGQQAVGTERTG